MVELSVELPMELVTELLARLPVKSLVRFRCVCKAWRSLISSPDFASLHLDRYHNEDDCSHFLIVTGDDGLYSRKYQWLVVSTTTYEKIMGDDYSILNNESIMARLGRFFPHGRSVNGLMLLFKDTNVLADSQWQRQIMVWNPMLGKTHKFFTQCTYFNAFMGLGYSRSGNDYKVVVIGTQPKTSVHVYSLGTRTWTSIFEYRESIISRVCFGGFSLIEGQIHFGSYSYEERSSHMVSFDVDKEVFTYTQLPYEPVLVGSRDLVVYHEEIGVLDVNNVDRFCSLRVRENDENGVECWREVYREDSGQIPHLMMLYFKKNGHFILGSEDGFKEKLYDVESREVKPIRETDPNFMVYCTLFKESLVWF